MFSFLCDQNSSMAPGADEAYVHEHCRVDDSNGGPVVGCSPLTEAILLISAPAPWHYFMLVSPDGNLTKGRVS